MLGITGLDDVLTVEQAHDDDAAGAGAGSAEAQRTAWVGPQPDGDLDQRGSRRSQQASEALSLVPVEFVQPFQVTAGHEHQPARQRGVGRQRQPPVVVELHLFPRP